MAYNPNSPWESKQKKYEYNPSDTPTAQATSTSAPATPVATNASVPSTAPKPTASVEVQAGGPSFFKRHGLALFAVGLVALLALAGLVFYLLLPAPAPNVGISFVKPDQIVAGSPFILSVSLTNYSNVLLKNADLTVMLPDGASFLGQAPSQRVLEQTIGDLGPQAENRKDFNLIVTGDPESVDHITSKLTYGTSNVSSNTQFETDGSVDVIVGQPAVGLTFTAPTNIFSGQNFDITVNYVNNTASDLDGLSASLQFPPAFNFIKSSVPSSVSATNSWDIGTLHPGEKGSFTVTGNIVGPEQALYSVTGIAKAEYTGQAYPVSAQTVNFAIASAPLSLSIDLNGSSSYVSALNDSLVYTLHYKNNSNITFQAVAIKAVLVGAMYNTATLRSQGSFDSRSNTLTWFAANAPQLAALSPGEEGTVTFTVQTKSAFPIRLLSDKNYTLKVNAQISSPTVPPNTAGSNTVSATALSTKVGGKLIFAEKGLWHDAPSGILNSGPYPPKVDQATQYTVHWILTNYATDIQNVTISAYLQSGSTFTGQVKSNISSTPVYDPNTGLITWTIPVVPAASGVLGPAVEAIFQIENTPAVNEVGQNVPLVGAATLKGVDAFTGNAVNANTQVLTTQLPDEASVLTQDRTVKQ